MKRSAVLSLLALGACVSSPPAVKDYERFYESAPYTIVVLPPTNQSVDAEAPRFFLSTITEPLVNRGYYVIPVEAVADMMAAEGLAEGGALEQVRPQKFREYFGADAILYIEITKWDTSYIVLASSVTVAMNYRLVHTDTGDVLWEETAQHTVSSDSGSGGGLGGLIAGMINAAVTATATEYVALARSANDRGLSSLPPGPYHKSFASAKARNLEKARRARETEKK